MLFRSEPVLAWASARPLMLTALRNPSFAPATKVRPSARPSLASSAPPLAHSCRPAAGKNSTAQTKPRESLTWTINAVIGKVGPGTDRPQSHEQTYQTKSFGAVAAWRRMGSKSGTCAVRFDNHLIHDTRLDLNRPPAVPDPTCTISAAVSMGRRNTKPEVYLQESQRLNSFTNVESNGTLPWLGF